MTIINLEQAVTAIKLGEVIAYPTEAVYGLGCDPFNQTAFNCLLKLKQRPIEKGVILIASSLSQIIDLVMIEGEVWTERVLESWKKASSLEGSPITWILPATSKVSSWITGGRSTVAVRVTSHPEVKALCDLLGMPLVSTSANITGLEPAKTIQDCHDYFPCTDILSGEVGGNNSPSQIWDAVTLRRLR